MEGAFDFHAVEGDCRETVNSCKCEMFFIVKEILIISICSKCVFELFLKSSNINA